MKHRAPVGLFKTITTAEDNITFDTGRFILIVVLGLVVFVVVLMTGIALWQLYDPTHKFDYLSFGGGIAALFGGFATLLGAFAAYQAVGAGRPAVLPAPEAPPAILPAVQPIAVDQGVQNEQVPVAGFDLSPNARPRLPRG